MSTSYLTKCPQCGSTFKINDQLLSAAGGKVRCGSCMTVFNAKDQLFDSDGTPFKGGPKSSLPDPSPSLSAARQENSVIEKFGQSRKSAEAPSTKDRWKPALINEETMEDPDEPVFEDNPAEDSEDKHYSGSAKRKSLEDDFDTEFLELELSRNHDFVEAGKTEEVVPHTKPSDESWAEKILEEELEKKASLPAQPPKPPSSAPSSSPPKEVKMAHQSHAISATMTEPLSASPYEQYKSLRFDPIDTSDGANSLKKLLIALACLLVVAGIVIQFAWLHREKLALYPQLRPAYEKFCGLISCTLPDMVDISAIRSQNLVVRSHPTVKNALLIDAVILNRAQFEQPFPSLVLFFSDLNNKVVTKRTFTPSEYLVGEAAHYKLMPIGTPIHLSIEVKDPGPEAVNYSLSFEKYP